MTRTNIVLTALIAVMLLAIFYLYNRVETLSRNNSNNETIIKEKDDSLHYFKTETRRIAAEKSAAGVTIKQLRESYPDVAAIIKKELGVNLKDVKAFIRNEIAAIGKGEGTIDTVFTKGDSIQYVPRASIDDGYLAAHLDFTTPFKFKYEYVYRDTISTVINTEKKGWFGKETLHVTTSLRNPNAKATSTTSMLVNNYRDKRFSVFIGGGYDILNNRPAIVAGIGYSLIKF